MNKQDKVLNEAQRIIRLTKAGKIKIRSGYLEIVLQIANELKNKLHTGGD